MTAIVVIAIILGFLAVDVLLVRATSPGQDVPMHAPRPPLDRYYDAHHLWLQLTPKGGVRVGLDDLLAQAIGEPEAVVVPPRGRAVQRGEPLFTLRVGGRDLEVPSPADGRVLQGNPDLVTSPQYLAVDPYGVGWAVELTVDDQARAVAPLMLGAEAATWLDAEARRMARTLPGGRAGTLAGDEYPPAGAAARLDDAGWASFQRRLLMAEGER